MSENLFASCKTESEIMKRIFELSGTGKYSRPELLHMSNARRAELQSQQVPGIEFIKIVIPEAPPQIMNELARQSVVIMGDPKGSSTFEFLPDGRVKF